MSDTPALSTSVTSATATPLASPPPAAAETPVEVAPASTVDTPAEDAAAGSSSAAAPAAAEPASEQEAVASAPAPVHDTARMAALDKLLSSSHAYAQIIGDKMEKQMRDRQEAAAPSGEASAPPGEGPSTVKEGKKRAAEGAAGDQVESATKKVKLESSQPALVTGAILRDYQLAGLEWMISLYQNGLNGILADEMGLGKTLQTISFIAHLRSKGVWGPFLVACPLSVLHNWKTEFEKFTPDIPVLMYHGNPLERQELRRTRLSTPKGAPASVGTLGVGRAAKTNGKKQKKDAKNVKTLQNTFDSFPVVITTYEIIMKDASFLGGLNWKFMVVDEGHRLKNMDCKLIREIKSKYTSANRLILTGTPLHNNLGELWALLNFILPDIFDDLSSFQSWFDLDADLKQDGTSSLPKQSNGIVHKLHAILKPFLLRRLKVDVEKSLPPKKEYLLNAPLTKIQKELYESVVARNLRQYLYNLKTSEHPDEPVVEEEVEEPVEGEDGSSSLGTRTRRSRAASKKAADYSIEEDDDAYFEGLEAEQFQEPEAPSAADIGREFQRKAARKQVQNMKLQNVVMQLRKVASHPFLFDRPVDPLTGMETINEDLVRASGKMLLLDRLLDELLKRKHKVLLFSQFTAMLDIIEDWAVEYKKLKICRIDGSTNQEKRREQMAEFNTGGEEDGVCRLFLLSTRAGGLGINLVAADTVIFYDQDWNPQADLQAQDRAHRIGQTRPVLVFRLVTAHTIETKILQKAGAKRMLEQLVIANGKFKGDLGRAASKKKSTLDEAANMLRLEGDAIEIVSAGDKIISDYDLDMLLDRSDEALARTTGWASSARETKAAGEGATFSVFTRGADEANDQLANLQDDDADPILE